MPKFRKKPLVIEAIQFTGDNISEIWDAFGTAGIYGPTEKNPDYLILTTVHGDPAPARVDDWVIPDGKPGTFYPCKPEIFAATYERVGMTSQSNMRITVHDASPHDSSVLRDLRRRDGLSRGN